MKIKSIILLILALMLLILAAVSCAPKKDDLWISDLGVSRSGLVSSDGWAYYTNVDGLFKVRPNGEDKTQVFDTTLFGFQIYEDRIYYMPFERSDGTSEYYVVDEGTIYSIYSCDINGSNEEFICEIPHALPSGGKMQMRVIDDWIYLGLSRVENSSSYDLYRMSIDGTKMTTINQEDEILFDYSIDEEWIYYVAFIVKEDEFGSQLWRMKHDGTNKQQVMQELGYGVDYTETEVYYIDIYDRVLYAVPHFGTEKRKVTLLDGLVFYIKVIGDWVYYIEYGENGGFYKVKTDGGEHIKIPVMTVPSETGIGVVDNWLIYAYVYDTEMVRISDTYDTDALFDWIHVDQLESALRKHDTDDPYNQMMAESYEEAEVRKYE